MISNHVIFDHVIFDHVIIGQLVFKIEFLISYRHLSPILCKNYKNVTNRFWILRSLCDRTCPYAPLIEKLSKVEFISWDFKVPKPIPWVFRWYIRGQTLETNLECSTWSWTYTHKTHQLGLELTQIRLSHISYISQRKWDSLVCGHSKVWPPPSLGTYESIEKIINILHLHTIFINHLLTKSWILIHSDSWAN